MILYYFFFSSRRRHTRWPRDWSSDVCSSDLSLDRFGRGERRVQGAAQGAVAVVTGYAGVEGGGRSPAVPDLLLDEQRRSEERRVGNEWRTEGGATGERRTVE